MQRKTKQNKPIIQSAKKYVYMGHNEQIKWLPGKRKGSESKEWKIKKRVFHFITLLRTEKYN